MVRSYLKMRTSYTLGDLFKQQLLNLLELCRLNDVQNLLDLAQEHDLCREVRQTLYLGVSKSKKTLYSVRTRTLCTNLKHSDCVEANNMN